MYALRKSLLVWLQRMAQHRIEAETPADADAARHHVRCQAWKPQAGEDALGEQDLTRESAETALRLHWRHLPALLEAIERIRERRRRSYRPVLGRPANLFSVYIHPDCLANLVYSSSFLTNEYKYIWNLDLSCNLNIEPIKYIIG